MFTKYSDELEKDMRYRNDSLSEKDRRRYAAIEAKKLGHGGIVYIATLFSCDEKTIRKGLKELANKESLEQATIRLPGGGRKPTIPNTPNIDEVFLEILRDHTAGDPMDEKIKWTNLGRGEIRIMLRKKGIKDRYNIVKKLLKKHNFVKRKALKKTSTGQHKNRDQQFKKISKLRAKYENSDNPIISIDAKKKESIGNLYRDGHLETTETIEVFDHDFPNLADEKVALYSVYDLKNNESFVNISTSCDTSDFVCDSIKMWWNTIGKRKFPGATSILILADGGGSNGSRHHVFKESLQNLSSELNIELRVAHYPPYTSKWNPIEHRVFPHITSSLSGVILLSVSMLKELVKKTKTKTGLKVFARVRNLKKTVLPNFHVSTPKNSNSLVNYYNN